MINIKEYECKGLKVEHKVKYGDINKVFLFGIYFCIPGALVLIGYLFIQDFLNEKKDKNEKVEKVEEKNE